MLESLDETRSRALLSIGLNATDQGMTAFQTTAIKNCHYIGLQNPLGASENQSQKTKRQ
jgi:hypothetical protein